MDNIREYDPYIRRLLGQSGPKWPTGTPLSEITEKVYFALIIYCELRSKLQNKIQYLQI